VEGVLEALRRGSFYASAGPAIADVRVEPGAIEVSCDPCRSVTLLTGVSSGGAVHAGRLGYSYAARITDRTPDGWITAARLDLPDIASYARLEIVDPLGRKAWTNSVLPG
jgi:hypothetical protein